MEEYLLLIATIVFVTALLLVFLVAKKNRKIFPVAGGINRNVQLPHEESVELYSNSFSHCSRKCRLVLAELNIDVKHHTIDLIETGWYQTISPAYLKVNPSGLVPTLVHKGHPIYESDDILAYAAEIAGSDAPNLIPQDALLRSRMFDWLQFCAISSDDAMAGMRKKAGACVPGLTIPMFAATIRYVPFRNIFVGFLFHFDKKRPMLFTLAKVLGLRRLTGFKPIRTLMHSSRDCMHKHLLTLNEALSEYDGDWILGETYSLADVSIACLLLRLEETTWLHWYEQNADLVEVTAYFNRLKKRPAWRDAITDFAHPIVVNATRDLSAAMQADQSLADRVYGSTAKIDDVAMRV